jgi:hypothetical protein
MVCDTIRGRRALAVAAAFAVATSALALSGPARAGDDNSSGNPLESLLSFTGMQPDKEKDNIDYRARPPLVVPPSVTLPPPVSASATRPASWPVDPDEAARRRAAADSRRPAPQVNVSSGNAFNDGSGVLSKSELLAGRAGKPDADPRSPTSECQVDSGNAACGGNSIWDRLKAKFGLAKGDDDVVAAGVEPPRDYLTEPPVGYRKPTSTTRATTVSMKPARDAGDSYGYIRDQAQKKTSAEDN